MKKYYILLLQFLIILSAKGQDSGIGRAKLSPLTKEFLLAQQKSADNKFSSAAVLRKHSDGKMYASGMIKVADAASAQRGLENIGANIGTKARDIWTVQVPVENVKAFTEIKGISYIQLDEPIFPTLDIARKTTRVDSVQNGINLPMRYSGKGVVVGVIDFGFDYNHPTFYDTLHTTYRIKKVWEQGGTGTPPTGYAYGNEILDTSLIKAQGTDNVLQTHGTCTTGMAAGSGYGSAINNDRFRGMAYEADIILVGVRRDSIEGQWQSGSFSDFLDGINYIFNYATSVGKPCVINISWGSHSGPHDGSSLFNQACNNISGPGKIIVMSAGNEGQEKIHLSKTFTPADSTVNTYLTFTPQVYKRTWVDVWGDPGKVFCANVKLFSNNTFGNATGLICIDDSVYDKYLLNANGDTCYVRFINSSAEFNGKPRMIIDIYNTGTDSVNVSMSDDSGTINAWDEYYYFGYDYGYQSAFDSLNHADAISGNTITTVSDMGAADSVLLVGAYASKVAFTDMNGNNWTYAGYVTANKLVPFSSRGPMIDGRIKPDITAPGLTIATAISSYDTTYIPTGSNSALTISAYNDAALSKTFYYGEFSGTSASSPASAGIVALMLQVKPDLGPKDIHDIISSTAINDSYTGVLPPSGNNNWGHGKINAYAAVKATLVATGIYTYEGENLACELFPNPGNGMFTVSYSSDKTKALQIEVSNATGAKIRSESWQVKNGNNLHSIDLTDMPSGLYLVKISSAKGFVTIKTVLK